MDKFDATVKEYVELRKDKKVNASEARTIQNKLNDLEKEILDNFEKTGKSKLTMDGETVFLKKDIFAGLANDENGEPISHSIAIAVLEEAGFEEFCPKKIHSSGLSSFFKELNETGKEIPEKLAGTFVMNEVFKISSRKAG